MKGWQTKTLGEVCDFEGGSQPPKSEFIHEEMSGYVRFLQIRDFASEKNVTYIPESKKNRLCRETDILIGRYGASVGKILTGKAGAYNVALMKTIPNLDLLESAWFYHYLISDEFQSRLVNIASRSAQDGFSKEDIYNFPVPVPPLPEQRRIVGILDKAFDGIATAKANAEKNLQNARAVFESHLEEMFTRQSTNWMTCPLADCLELITYGFTNPMPTTDSGPYMVTAKNVNGGRVDYVNARHTSQEAFEGLLTDKSRPRVGDVLLTKDGTLGRLAVVERANLCINQSVALLRPNGKMIPHFMRHLLSSRSYQERMIGDADGATIKHIYITRVDKMDVAFPSKDVQQRIVDGLDQFANSARELERIYGEKLAALEALKKSLLHQAFSGEL